MKFSKTPKSINELVLNEMSKDSLMAYNHMVDDKFDKTHQHPILKIKGLYLLISFILLFVVSLVFILIAV